MTAAKARRRPAAQGVTLLTVPEAAERLSSGPSHVYRLIAVGELAAVDIAQPGARKTKTRVRSDEIDRYIEAKTRGSAADREPQPAA